jgi:hypothetical protein
MRDGRFRTRQTLSGGRFGRTLVRPPSPRDPRTAAAEPDLAWKWAAQKERVTLNKGNRANPIALTFFNDVFSGSEPP